MKLGSAGNHAVYRGEAVLERDRAEKQNIHTEEPQDSQPETA